LAWSAGLAREVEPGASVPVPARTRPGGFRPGARAERPGGFRAAAAHLGASGFRPASGGPWASGGPPRTRRQGLARGPLRAAHIREETSVKVLLIRRWGSHKAHTSVVVDEKQGAWLVDRGWGVEVAEPEPAREVVSGDEAPARHARRAASPSSGSGRRARKPKVVDEESSAS